MSDLQTEQRNRTTMVPRGTGWAVIDEITLCEFGYYERHADAWAMVRETTGARRRKPGGLWRSRSCHQT